MGNNQAADLVDPPAAKKSVTFQLNGREVVVQDASPLLTLNDWLRTQPGLAGTKHMCSEGGCGCCVVTAATSSLLQVSDDDSWDCHTLADPNSSIAINSCLCPLYAVEGWHITTVEGIGSSHDGYHPIQLRLADYNGTQCGYCTPGFVMSMYSLLQANPHPTKQQVEDNFDGNICRCTGYRPILDAMKSFASDPKAGKEQLCTDIEDLSVKVCPRTNKACHSQGLCQGYKSSESGPSWYSPTSTAQLAGLRAANPEAVFRFVAGDTGKGVYKNIPHVDMLISLSKVAELHQVQVSESSLTVGAAISLTNLISLLQSNAEKSPNFDPMAKHLLKIANRPVRNLGTWAGNVMITHAHQDFPSDVFLLLAASQATLTTGSLSDLATFTHSLWDLLKLDMSASIILSVKIPFLPKTVTFKSYKIMPRAENAAAHASAAFAMEVDSSDKYKVKGTPTLVVGGGQARPVPCPQTANFLTGKSLLDANTLAGCMQTLGKELDAALSADVYKQSVALGLLYKFYLSCTGDQCSPSNLSAASVLLRPVSSGTQIFSTDASEFPAGQPLNKLAAKLQASGEAQFTTDLPSLPNELAAAFVLTTKANVTILSMDTSVAEKMAGFVQVLTARDIPPGGVNNFVSPKSSVQPEEIFADYRSEYVGQSVALVLADTRQNAEKIAKAITLEYGEVEGEIIVSTADAVEKHSLFPQHSSVTVGDVASAIAKSDKNIRGQIECGSQYHFTMETHAALVVPGEGDTYSVYSSTQFTTYVQTAVSQVLGIPASSVDVSVMRVGGGYGAKIIRSNLPATACALGAHVTKRPVRMHMDLETNMKLIGKRFPYLATYQVGFSKEGIINGISVNVFGNAGWSINDSSADLIANTIDNAYHVANWEINIRFCKTNTAVNTACRSPGTVPATFIMESIMDHVAKTLGMNVEAVKKMNLYKQGDRTPTGLQLQYCHISTLWEQLYQSAEVARRTADIATFNKANRWMKRGISVVPLKFPMYIGGIPYTVLVSIFAEDGTVAVSHGGVEIGQGIHTKVAQVAAMTLKVPMEKVVIKPTSTIASPNSTTTGGSSTSELVCQGVIKACQMLNDRIKPVRDKNSDLSWRDLIAACYSQNMDLSAKYWVCFPGDVHYVTYGVTVTEVELDVLTGQVQIPRVDILYDCGNSINPKIDVGQVEGAFIMGLGYWLTEKLDYDTETGELTTYNTWTYKPPSSKDIPIDFRVELLKNASNPVGVLGSKAVGEPPLCMSCSSLFAVKRAIEEARKDVGNEDFFPLSGPATIEAIHSSCLVNTDSFTI